MVFTILYAASADGYFQPPRTRWEWGGIGGQPLTVAALCLAAVATLVLTLGWRRNTSVRVRVGGLLAAAAAFGLMVIAWLALTIGH